MTSTSLVGRLSAMATTMRVRPARDGLRVIDPRTRRPIDSAGVDVPADGYWTRRLQQGDVVLVDDEDERERELPE